jgi:hypothetical protein
MLCSVIRLLKKVSLNKLPTKICGKFTEPNILVEIFVAFSCFYQIPNISLTKCSISEVSGTQGGEYEDDSLLGYSTV